MHYKTNNRGLKKVLEKKKQIDEAMAKFNAGRSSGLRGLRELGVIGEGPDSLAYFLKNDPRVSHFVIGEIFGGEEDFNVQVLDIYLSYDSFENMNILEALRYFLSLFELPGEG